MFRTILASGVEKILNSTQMKPVPPSEKLKELVLIGEPLSKPKYSIYYIRKSIRCQPKKSEILFNQIS
tara:strand:+ start:682 stop:885 length:204 start_codon:yes stop_codon:yes gene_type:complete